MYLLGGYTGHSVCDEHEHTFPGIVTPSITERYVHECYYIT